MSTSHLSVYFFLQAGMIIWPAAWSESSPSAWASRTILVIMAILTTLMATPLFNRIMRDRPATALPATGGPPA
jgi:hypothetical protein